MNSLYGFQTEVYQTYGPAGQVVFTELNACFEWMPLAAVVSDSVFCVHGGISPLLGSLRQIKTFHRPIHAYEHSVIDDLVWSDPSTVVQQYETNPRGHGTMFGAVAVREFLDHMKLRYIIRAHECVPRGVECFANTVYTVFSSSNYEETGENRCGLIYITADQELTVFSLPPFKRILREIALMKTPPELGTEEKPLGFAAMHSRSTSGSRKLGIVAQSAGLLLRSQTRTPYTTPGISIAFSFPPRPLPPEAPA
jgi:diadenosine tetraphosphatase ApaH/serine/threonine PP2A family protein phosphatase